jgi:phage shock protein C
MAVYCTRCGAGLPASARFCSNCGVTVPAPQVAPGGTLIRPRAGRQIAGVCLALARAYGWDVSAVRIITVLALFFSSGLVGVAYLAAWIGIPEEPPDFSSVSTPGAPPPGVYPPGV